MLLLGVFSTGRRCCFSPNHVWSWGFFRHNKSSPCRNEKGRMAELEEHSSSTDNERAFRTHLVPQLAVCSALARPWPPADGICGFCPSSEKDAPWFGRLLWHWEIPGLSFELSYQCEPSSQCWICAYESDLCSGLAAWK